MKDYNEDQYDLLRELTNIAIGHAAAELDQKLNTTIEISIPKASIITFADTRGKLLELYGRFDIVSVVKQPFAGLLKGEALLFFNANAIPTAASLSENNTTLTPEREQSLLLEVSTILAHASLNGLAESLDGEIDLSAPTLFCQYTPFMEVLDTLFDRDKMPLSWKYSLLINVIFTAKQDEFDCFIVIFLSEPSIEMLRTQLDRLIEEEY